MNQLLNKIDNIFEEKSFDINNLKNSRDVPFRIILKSYEKIVTDITKSVKDIIITASTQHTSYKYHPVVKFNSLLLGKKIIWIDNYFQKIHMDKKEANDYINWRPIDDEKNNLHWGRCFPKGKERYIVIHQDNKVNENKIEIIETKDSKNDPSSLTHKKHYVCHFPDFTGLTNDNTVREKIKDIFEKYNGYLNKLQGDIYKHFEYDKIKKAAPEDVIKYLFEPAVVLGWKSLFTVTHEYAGIEFIGEIEYVPSLYICKEDKINLDDKDEFEILLKIDELYHEATKKLLLLEQEFIHDYLGIAHLPNRVWNTWNDYIEKERFDRYRVLPTCSQDNIQADKDAEQTEQDDYYNEIKNILLKLLHHFDDFCKKRNIWLIINYCSIFLTDKVSDFLLSDFEDDSSVEDLCKQIKALKWDDPFFNSLYNNVDWLNSLLQKTDLYDIWPQKMINDTIKCLAAITKEYRQKPKSNSLSELQQNNVKRLNRLLLEENCPDITPIVNIRLNAIRTPSVTAIIKKLKPSRLSWYGIFGTINNNIVLRMSKATKTTSPIISKKEGLEIIYEDVYRLKIPEGDGVVISDNEIDRSSLRKYTSYIAKFKEALTKEKLLSRDGKSFLHGSKGAILLENADDKAVAKDLFQNKNIKEWNECLMISSKYLVDFADSLNYFPNILFFKENIEFTDDDVLFCKMLNVLYVKIVTELLKFENEILLNRLEDLVDSKPQRFFDKKNTEKLSKKDKLPQYKPAVKEIYHYFIKNNIRRIHPMIRSDLLIAFYLYRTKYFKDKEEYILFYWNHRETEQYFNQWLNIYKKKEKKAFDFKDFIFGAKGEKSPIEFERKDAEDFIFFVNSLPEPKKIEEFYTIVIGNLDDIKKLGDDKNKYYDYLQNKLARILADMAIDKNDRAEDLATLISSGKKAAEYFSLFCKDNLEKTGYRFIYYIPSVNYDGSSYGGFSFFCKNKWARSITKGAQDWATRFGATFAEIEREKITKKETIKHGSKSAMLSINVRNLSHNIASHVLAYWIQELNQLLQDFSGDNQVFCDAIKKSKAVFRYIQHRADFLAEVATSVPCSEMSLDIKRDILNPFVSDSDPSNDFNEINKGIDIDSNVYVLLRYIAESEGISINFNAEGEQKTTKIITCKIDESLKEKDKEKPVWVSIPSGLIGKHAIYSILENFIRNAAKHYEEIEKNSNFIQIEVGNHNKDYIKIEITDIRRASCKPEYVKDLNKFIEGGFVNDQGRLEPGGWGIKEMLISANFLRKNTPEYLYDVITKKKTCNPKLLEIICTSNKNKNGKPLCNGCNHNKNLGIRFYLKKPKHLAVLTSSSPNIQKNVFEIKKITTDFKDKPIPYNILLVDNSEYNSYKDNPLAPCRVMNYDKSVVNGKNSTINDDCYLALYKKFIEDEIWKKHKNLPKIVNNLSEQYEFEENDDNDLCIKSLTNESSNNNICFVSHPERPESMRTAYDYFTNSHYFQPMSGGFSTKAKLFKNYELDKPIRRNFYLELIESALTKVVIVDERISEWADKKSKYKLCNCSNSCNCEPKTVREMVKKMHVYVAKIEKNVSNLKKKLTKNVLGCSVLKNKSKTKDNDTVHFFVIHQGILDKLNGNDKEQGKEKEFMGKISCRWKVIDSGRGVPENMDYRFVQISALQTLLENYDKHGLVQTLFSLRKPVKEGESEYQS